MDYEITDVEEEYLRFGQPQGLTFDEYMSDGNDVTMEVI